MTQTMEIEMIANVKQPLARFAFAMVLDDVNAAHLGARTLRPKQRPLLLIPSRWTM